MQPMTTGPRRKAVRDGRRQEATGRHPREVRTQTPILRDPNAFARAYAEARGGSTPAQLAWARRHQPVVTQNAEV